MQDISILLHDSTVCNVCQWLHALWSLRTSEIRLTFFWIEWKRNFQKWSDLDPKIVRTALIYCALTNSTAKLNDSNRMDDDWVWGLKKSQSQILDLDNCGSYFNHNAVMPWDHLLSLDQLPRSNRCENRSVVINFNRSIFECLDRIWSWFLVNHHDLTCRTTWQHLFY